MKTKTVVVVGGSTGIGKELVTTFKNLGANVKSISRANCDITKQEEIDLYFSNINQVDILINNAAINYCKSIEEISLNEWNSVIDTNLTSYFYIIKKCLPLMKYGSKIVNVSSIAGRSKSLVSGVHYTSSKAGLIGLTRQLAQELGPKGININCVCPSQTLTPMLERSMTNEQLSELSNNIPLRRIAKVNEIVKPILFLCSEDASYIHGACLDINGGQL
jgi:3-oxoacyl-[acyl-carrier protein] reductase|tara:strand:+ start:4420 stop:5076 length:657 start_codon:yes stop_codon:yes gene_type:complete